MYEEKINAYFDAPERRAELVGGLVLVLIGVKILAEHLAG